jgi:hypothetical protein
MRSPSSRKRSDDSCSPLRRAYASKTLPIFVVFFTLNTVSSPVWSFTRTISVPRSALRSTAGDDDDDDDADADADTDADADDDDDDDKAKAASPPPLRRRIVSFGFHLFFTRSGACSIDALSCGCMSSRAVSRRTCQAHDCESSAPLPSQRSIACAHDAPPSGSASATRDAVLFATRERSHLTIKATAAACSPLLRSAWALRCS